jgi:hypothetical protein
MTYLETLSELRAELLDKVIAHMNEYELDAIEFKNHFIILITEEDSITCDPVAYIALINKLHNTGDIEGQLESGDHFEDSIHSLNVTEIAYILDELEDENYTIIEDTDEEVKPF